MIQNIQVKAKKKVVIRDSLGRRFPIDATISEDHLFSSQVTMHEIETGDNVSDHVIKKPFQLTLNGVISGDPYPEESTVKIDDDVPGPSAWTGDRFQKIGSGAFSGMVGSLAGSGITGAAATLGYSKISGNLLQKAAELEAERARQKIASRVGDNNFSVIVKSAYDIFKSIHQERIPVEITTGLDVHQNMVMESLSLPRNSGTVRSLPFTASFRQVNFVTGETVTIPKATDTQATMDRSTPVTTQGTKQTTTPTEAVGRSGLRYITDYFGITNPND